MRKEKLKLALRQLIGIGASDPGVKAFGDGYGVSAGHVLPCKSVSFLYGTLQIPNGVTWDGEVTRCDGMWGRRSGPQGSLRGMRNASWPLSAVW